MRTTFAAVLFLLPCYHAVAQPSPQTVEEIRKMHWVLASGARLESSKSSIATLSGFEVVTGAEAQRFRLLADGHSSSNIEAEAFNPNTDSEVIYEWVPAGYIKSDDWGDLNADDLLEQMKSNDAKANEERRQHGLPTITTTGWRQRPQLNQDTHTVSWSITGNSSAGEAIVNFVALKLGRYGFERIVWIIDPAKADASNDLLLAVANHRFDDGARYTDYVAGTDHAAEYGVAGLVAGALGVKLLKVAGIGALLLGMKKFAIVLLLPFIWGWKKVAGLFKRSPNPVA